MKYTSGMRSLIDIINEDDGEQHRTNMTPAEYADAMNVLTRYSERRSTKVKAADKVEVERELKVPDDTIDYNLEWSEFEAAVDRLNNFNKIKQTMKPSGYHLKNDPDNTLGVTPNNTNISDLSWGPSDDNISSKTHKLITPVTGTFTDSDGKISHITANPDGTGKVDTSVQDAIEYTKKLKAKIAAKAAAAAKTKAKKDKEEVEVATARFMASKEAKAQRDRYNKRHDKEHTYAKNVQTGRERYLAMRQKQEEREMRRDFLRKQQIENQKKRQAYYRSMYGRRPYR
jgi:hypothetical protein